MSTISPRLAYLYQFQQDEIFPSQGSNIFGTLYIAVFGLLPVYIWSSGGFQLVDVPMFLTFCGMFLFVKKSSLNRQVCMSFLPLVIYAFLMNGIKSLFVTSIWFLLNPITIAYAFFIMYYFQEILLKILASNRLIFIYLGFIASIIISFIAKGVDEEARVILSFNDPNQLSYFAAILVAFIIILMEFKNKTNTNKVIFSLFDAIIIIVAHYYLLLSLSRSGMAAFAILDIYLIFSLRKIKLALPILLAATFSFLFIFFIRPHYISQRLEGRSDHLTEDHIEKSFHGRFWAPLEQMHGIDYIFGKITFEANKSVGTSILKKRGTDKEVHNMLGETFRSYGIIGLSLLMYWIIKFVTNIKNITSAFWAFGALMLYNMGNNGMRFRAFWLWVAMVLAMEAYMNIKNNKEDKKIV